MQSECMRLRQNKAGKAQARGHYRGGIRGRSNPSPSGCTYLRGKSRMTSQLRQLARGGEGGLEEQCPQGGTEATSRCQGGTRAINGEDEEKVSGGYKTSSAKGDLVDSVWIQGF